jgi:hypothetical protein
MLTSLSRTFIQSSSKVLVRSSIPSRYNYVIPQQIMSGFHTANRLKGFDAPTVWSEFTPLSQKHKSVNLGQGFPDWETPQFAKDALIEVCNYSYN